MGNGYCPDDSGHCYVAFYDAPFTYPNYKVVDTDYVSYSIVYACDFHQYVWFLTREPVISDEQFEEILKIAVKSLPYFDWTQLNQRTYQGEGCDYWPPASDVEFL